MPYVSISVARKVFGFFKHIAIYLSLAFSNFFLCIVITREFLFFLIIELKEKAWKKSNIMKLERSA